MSIHRPSGLFRTKEEAAQILKAKTQSKRCTIYYAEDERLGVVKHPKHAPRWSLIYPRDEKGERYQPIGAFEDLSLEKALLAVDMLASCVSKPQPPEFKPECPEGPSEATVFESVELLDEHIRSVCRAMLLEALGAKE